MGQKDSRVDAYIAKSADFAKPILNHLRKLVHQACPDVAETMKWGFPHFEYKGILCSMAAFKSHCAFGFWKGTLLADDKVLKQVGETAMGDLGRLTKMSDLPGDRELIRLIKKAKKLNDEGVKLPHAPKANKDELDIPAYFWAAVRKNKRALKTFESFSYSNKKDYVEWVTEAKGEETRRKRLETAVAWMAEGKARNWKYIRKSKSVR
ncbi:MAG TPA: YdeI/OmpD-associated family protein [Candidatus Deferrimicrobium sp.]|nr:YdeI/OmpD-associated family protein [Candidatus Deferrimicrobium sp.]